MLIQLLITFRRKVFLPSIKKDIKIYSEEILFRVGSYVVARQRVPRQVNLNSRESRIDFIWQIHFVKCI